MKPKVTLTPEFVQYIPNDLEEGTIYISIEFAIAVHKCCCGCGNKVVMPLSPTGWKLIYDGESISLDPSIGNWSFPCQSHYWIENNRVEWARKWSQDEISAGRAHDSRLKERYYGSTKTSAPRIASIDENTGQSRAKGGFWQSVKKWFS